MKHNWTHVRFLPEQANCDTSLWRCDADFKCFPTDVHFLGFTANCVWKHMKSVIRENHILTVSPLHTSPSAARSAAFSDVPKQSAKCSGFKYTDSFPFSFFFSVGKLWSCYLLYPLSQSEWCFVAVSVWWSRSSRCFTSKESNTWIQVRLSGRKKSQCLWTGGVVLSNNIGSQSDYFISSQQ